MVEEFPFRFSTGLKNIIGKELITDDDIAIFELVKNSYDANAHNVKIVFQDLKSPSLAKIFIIDDGHGMSKDDILNKWLFVGYSEKKMTDEILADKDYRNKIQLKKRIFAGAKGIGRFSADRLGQRLKLYTKREKEKEIHELEMNWKDFEDQNEEFETIKTRYSQINRVPEHIPLEKRFELGTILEISSLNSKWDYKKLQELKKYLQRLINPSQDPEKLDFKIELIARDFLEDDKEVKIVNDRINGNIKNVVFEKLGIKTTMIKSEINSSIIKTVLEDKGRLVVEFEEDNKFDLLDNISVRIFYLNPAAKRSFTSIMGLEPKNFGSILLYKNGFRIQPYGNVGDDWLDIERRKAQGVTRYLSTREVMGRAEVYGVQRDFVEVSSRSGGLIKNSAFVQLTTYLSDVVFRRLERYVVEGLDWDSDEADREKSEDEIKTNSVDIVLKLAVQAKNPRNIKFGKDLISILREKESEEIPHITKNLEKLKKSMRSSSDKKKLGKLLKSFKKATRTLAAKQKELEQELKVKKNETLFLEKAISYDKDTTLNLVHAIKISAQAIENGLYKVNTKLKNMKGMEELIPFFDKIGIEIQKVHRISKIITTAKFDLRANMISTDLVQYISQYLQVGSDKSIYEIDVRIINGGVFFVTEFQPIEISLIFDNFISNSSKARANVITVKFNKSGNNLRILIGDNGKGIPREIQKLIFSRAFSTTRSGSGLGLHYNKAMVESMRGSINYLGNNIAGMGKGACFEVILPERRT